LHDLDEDHLAEILLGASRWPMRAHQFCHQRVETPDQFPSRVIVVPQSRTNQLPRDAIISHVKQSKSTLLKKTARRA
jgi:hypothetical protein